MALEVAKLMASIGADISGLLGGLSKANESLMKTGESMINIGIKMSSLLTTPLVMVGKSAVDARLDIIYPHPQPLSRKR